MGIMGMRGVEKWGCFYDLFSFCHSEMQEKIANFAEVQK